MCVCECMRVHRFVYACEICVGVCTKHENSKINESGHPPQTCIMTAAWVSPEISERQVNTF